MESAECLALLSTHSIGRLGLSEGERGPLVIPVNYVVHDGSVLFRTDPGSVLDTVSDDEVSFQVDSFDWITHTGWSVLVRGWAREVPAPADVDLQPWARGAKEHWVEIRPSLVTGRRIELPAIDANGRGYL
jgi:nitroimidazol reductase NimA-like FMN-containing flavoprotein (pyridoxamine 5'-phosphate oxidase superfamily)